MFERYTEKARRPVFFARYEASQFGSPYIETEQLLLGILREDKTLTNTFLHSLASVESIRKQIEKHTLVREKVSTSVDLPLSNECKRILVYAAEEAEHLSHKFIGTGHLFLGVLREGDCFAAQLLNERGISLDTAREQVGSKAPEMLVLLLDAAGLPAGYTSHKLIYNIATETLILELRRPGSVHLLPTRLFVRHKDAEAYEQIGSPAEDVFYESPLTCDSSSSGRVQFHEAGQSAKWRGLGWGLFLQSQHQGTCALHLSVKTAILRASRTALDCRTCFAIRGCSYGLCKYRHRESRVRRRRRSLPSGKSGFGRSRGEVVIPANGYSLLRCGPLRARQSLAK